MLSLLSPLPLSTSRSLRSRSFCVSGYPVWGKMQLLWFSGKGRCLLPQLPSYVGRQAGSEPQRMLRPLAFQRRQAERSAKPRPQLCRGSCLLQKAVAGALVETWCGT